MPHVVSGLYPKEFLVNKESQILVNFAGAPLQVTRPNDTFFLTLGNLTAKVVWADILAQHLIVHAIDTFLIPEDIYAALLQLLLRKISSFAKI